MSDTDSFIDEVNDEVRRDKLFGMLKRYGWIAGLAVFLIVGGAAWSEYNKAQARAKAEALGDGMLSALVQDAPDARLAALKELDPENATAQALVSMLAASEAQQDGDVSAAVAELDAISINGDVPEIYRQVAAFKSLTVQAGTLDASTRRQGYEALSMAGSPLRLLSVEQLALMDVSEGAVDSAIDRYQNILRDASVTPDLQQRALQVIVALGGTPDMADLPTSGN